MVSSGDGGCISSENINVALGSMFSAGMDLTDSRQAAGCQTQGWVMETSPAPGSALVMEWPRDPRLLPYHVQWLILSMQKPF